MAVLLQPIPGGSASSTVHAKPPVEVAVSLPRYLIQYKYYSQTPDRAALLRSFAQLLKNGDQKPRGFVGLKERVIGPDDPEPKDCSQNKPCHEVHFGEITCNTQDDQKGMYLAVWLKIRPTGGSPSITPSDVDKTSCRASQELDRLVRYIAGCITAYEKNDPCN